jgi:hypothetical protein
MRRYTIYGIRLKGETEVRYVGLTYKTISVRLREHRRTPCVPGLSGWIVENGDQVEIFAIASVDNEAEAKATEKVLILLCARLNHRLFNRANVPTHLQWSPRVPQPAAIAA